MKEKKIIENLIFDKECRAKLYAGVEKLTKAVQVTMGPRGRNVIISKKGRRPILTKDGVTVARSVNLTDRLEDAGVQVVKEAAIRTAEVAGDGTTTATVLTHAILKDGIELLDRDSGDHTVYPSALISSLKALQHGMIENLYTNARIIREGDVFNVATISANGDENIGHMIDNAIKEVGVDGVIIIEEGKTSSTCLNLVNGTMIKRGYMSPYFINDVDKQICTFDDPYVCIIDAKLNNLQTILPILERAHTEEKGLLLIAHDYEKELIKALTVNKIQAGLKICAIRAPEFGDLRSVALEDLANLLDTSVLQSIKGQITIDENTSFGKVKKIEISKDSTLFVGCEPNEKYFALKSIVKKELDEATIDLERKILTRRYNRLNTSMAILSVGAATETEMLEIKDRVDDALHATSAAIKSGILPGGGIALFKLAQDLEYLGDDKTEAHAYAIMKSACTRPIAQIMLNADLDPDKILDSDLIFKSFEEGYDVRQEEYVNMFDAGIVDPCMVTVEALTNAISTACNILSVGAVVLEDLETETLESQILNM